MKGTWIGLNSEEQDTSDRVTVDGDNVDVIKDGVTKKFRCIDTGLFYGEYLWQSKDNEDSYLCVLKKDVDGKTVVDRIIGTATGDFNPVPTPEMTDLEYTSLCVNEIAEDVLNLRKQ
ncbi:uncharacterized protein [Argopecten irradians]|uniref:uncharacterized protein n=1 Tax=Argopecten irradians TaxID=31199 RepID=UPI00371BF761